MPAPLPAVPERPRQPQDPPPPSQPCRRCGDLRCCLTPAQTLGVCLLCPTSRDSARLSSDPHIRVHCLRLLRINCHCHFSFYNSQEVCALQPPISAFSKPGPDALVGINLYAHTIPLSAQPAVLPANQQDCKSSNHLEDAGTHYGQQLLKDSMGSLFESKNHLSQHNIVLYTITVIFGYFHNLNMSNMSSRR